MNKITVLTALALGLQMAAGTACTPADQASAGDPYARLQAFIAESDAQDLARDPTLRTYRSITTSEPDWTIEDDPYFDASVALIRQRLEALSQQVDRAALNAEQRHEYDIYVDELNTALLNYKILRNGFTLDVNVFDPSWKLPQALQRQHRIESEQDAANYVSRLTALPHVLERVLATGEERTSRGVVLQAQDYVSLGERAQALAQGAPCEAASDGQPHVLYADFSERIDTLVLDPGRKQALLDDARKALATQLCPAYARFATAVAAMAPQGREGGTWALPGGRETYLDLVEFNLGEKVDPQHIHQVGLDEVERMQAEISAEFARIGITGGMAEFNRLAEEDPRYSVPNSEAGFAAHLGATQAKLEWINSRLSDYFLHVPTTPLQVRRTTFGPDGKPGGEFTHYTPAPWDGTGPAYFNLGFPTESPPDGPERESTLVSTAIAYHEGNPGHHMQQATAIEMKRRVPLRRYHGYMSYIEGWGVYGEHIADEMGGFDGDDYARIAWMQAHLRRAATLVVETGINYLGWTPQQAMDYHKSVVGYEGSVQRYMDWPGQALGYYWGYLQFEAMREKAEAALGDRFSIKAFHHLMLKDGVVSMRLLKQAVDEWIAEAGGSTANE